jgi:hypothetical protein
MYKKKKEETQQYMKLRLRKKRRGKIVVLCFLRIFRYTSNTTGDARRSPKNP